MLNTEGAAPARVLSTALPTGGVQSVIALEAVEGIDLATETIGLMVAEAAYTANARVLAMSQRLERAVLDLSS